MINSVCGYGSTGRICTGIQNVLKNDGHDSLICYGRGRAPSNCKSYRIGSEIDITVHGLLSRFNDKHGLYSSQATKALIAKIKSYSPDIINLHNIHGYYLNYKLLFEFLAEYDRPVVWTLHDCWSFTGQCAHFYNNQCDKWLTGCNDCGFKSSYPKTVGFSRSAKNFELKKKLFTSVNKLTFVSPSKWLAQLAKRSFLGKYDVRVINNGIDLDTFKPTDSDFRKKYGLENKMVILGVSNAWGHLKGLDTFNRLSEMLDESFKIVLVGVTSKNRKYVSDNIITINKTANVRELAEIYSSADVYLNPTLQDNFPTVNIEALACGTPVITYNSGGSGEMITDKNGIIVERGDFDGLFETVSGFKKIGINRSDCVSSAAKYDQTMKFKQYKELYDELFEER